MDETNSKQIISKWLGLTSDFDASSAEQLVKNACLQALLDVAHLIVDEDWAELDKVLAEGKDEGVREFLQTRIPNLEDVLSQSGAKVLADLKARLARLAA